MSSSEKAGGFVSNPDSSSSLTGNLSLLREIAESFRRVKGDEDYDAKGIRTIWHQGRLRTEMLSWEDREGQIVRQELCMFGLVVEFRRGKPLQTGKLPMDDKLTGGGRPMANLVKPDTEPVGQTLDYASHLLKNVPERDFYAQHLLKEVNHWVTKLGYDESRTIIGSLEGFSKKKKSSARAEATQRFEMKEHATKGIGTGLYVVLGILGVLLGLGIGYLLW